MKKLKASYFIVPLLAAMSLSNTVWAKGSELKFESTVSEITETESGLGVIKILVKGFHVPVLVDEDTKIENEGDGIDFLDLVVGDSVRIEAYFEDSAIVAEEIRILERDWEQFRFRGEITDIEFAATPTATTSLDATRITVLGVDVFVDGETKITRRGSGEGNDVPPSDLMTGDQVDVSGSYTDSLLWADRIKVGERELGDIEIEGEFLESTADGFYIDLRESGKIRVIVDENTEVDGDLTEGSSVKVEGVLNESIQVLATEVDVQEGGKDDKDKEDEKDEEDNDD